MNKNTLSLNILLLAALAGPAAAYDSPALSSLKGSPAVPAAHSTTVTTVQETIGLEVAVRVPFSLVKNQVQKMAKTNTMIAIIDPDSPVLVKSGEFLKIVNLNVNAGGIMVTPTLTLKPYFESKDHLAIKVQQVQLHVSMSPSRSRAPDMGSMTQEDIMAQVMDTLISSVNDALSQALVSAKAQAKAQDVLSLKYDKANWTLHSAISLRFVKNYLPDGMVGDFHLTGFSFSDNALALKIATN